MFTVGGDGVTDLATRPGAEGAPSVDPSVTVTAAAATVADATEPTGPDVAETAIATAELHVQNDVETVGDDAEPAEAEADAADSDIDDVEAEADAVVPTEPVVADADDVALTEPDDVEADADVAALAEPDVADVDVAEQTEDAVEPAEAETAAATTVLPEQDAVDVATATTVLPAPNTELPAEPATTVLAEPDATEAGATYAWAPAEPAPKKRHLGLWIGIPAGVAALALVASSLVLIAPGTSIAGVPVGGLTPGAAADAVQHRLDETTIVLTGTGDATGGQLGASVSHAAADEVAVTGAQLGATVDARGLADSAFAGHPMWNPTAWFSEPVDAVVMIDTDAATAALREVAPELYTEPTDAKLDFDAATATYVVTPAIDGEGVDVDAVRQALQKAFDEGKTRVEVAATTAPVTANTPTYAAQAGADRLNRMLDTAGFYVGAERTVPVDRAVAASWITVSTDERGAFVYKADQAAIQQVVDTLAPAVDRAPVNAVTITDSQGKVLRDETVGVDGRALESTTGIAKQFAAQLATGNAVYELPVAVTPFATTSIARRIEVDLGEQRAYLFENDVVVQSWYISSGLPGNDTDTGHFRITSKLRTQNMGNQDLTKAPNYYTPNVPWVMYYNGDEALHGAYWHNNFGNRMSHGCVNMPLGAAEFVYGWAPMGTEVWVHY